MDLSERWRLACQAFSYVAVFSLSGSGFYFAYRMQRRWKLVLLFSVSSLLLLGSGLALWFDMTFIWGTRLRGPAIPSPDGTHVAVVYWDLSGAIGFDHVNVLIRSKRSPFTTAVFRGMAQSPPRDPKVFWTDNKHLLISYWDKGQTTRCEPQVHQVDGIDVLCQE